MKLEGLNKVLRNIDKKSQEIQKNVTFELERGAQNIRTGAIQRVPTDTSRLKTSIQISRPSKKERLIYTPVRYAPYVEFGTGAFAQEYLADKSIEMRNYAMQFYVNGKGRLPARPFMFPAYEAERSKILKRMKQAVK